MFGKDEIIQMLTNKFPKEDKNVIVREVNKKYGIWE